MNCQVCGREPATQIVIRRHVGMILMQRFYKVRVTACQEHGKKLVLSWTGQTLVQGWWGVISFFANILTILANLVALFKVTRLPAPQLGSSFRTSPRR